MQDKESLTGEQVEGQTLSASKRSFLKSAWVAPVIMTVTLPRSGYAANISGGGRPNEDEDKSKQKDDNGNHFGELKKDS